MKTRKNLIHWLAGPACLAVLLLATACNPAVVSTSTPATPLPPAEEPIQATDTPTPEVSENDEKAVVPQGESEPNRLINEQSPYLLQHAYNPVDWYPWGEEAFEKARRENKPILLSIGYSTCHWCHVMEEESFSDPQVAALINEVFVPIKVDREERPDIDAIYMNVAMLMNGSGGWPLNVMMSPDQKPFYVATYIPKESRFGRVGMLELLPRVQEAWLNQNDSLLSVGDRVSDALNPMMSELPGDPLDSAILDAAADQFAIQFDPEYGGFGTHPKFPSPHNLLFLLRSWQRTGNPETLAMVETTLRAMRNGGIYDQVGYGFHRYSTDAQWLVPHFEKMLYDQALLAMAYTEAHQATGNEAYRRTAEEIFTYVLRDMTAPEGGFYSAEDADSEGEEGIFYLWTLDQISEVPGAEEAELAIDLFGLTEEGNYFDAATGERTRSNILHLSAPISQSASDLGLDEAELSIRLDGIRQQLFDARERRVHPHKDDKILTDWNGLMISALAKAGQAFDEPRYTEAATVAADFILSELRSDQGRLLHRYRNGEAAIHATVDDYAFLVWGLLDLYEATFDQRYLEEAIALNDELAAHFWDSDEGGFFFTPDDGEQLLARPKEGYDGALPSGNSVAMLNQVRLGRFTGDTAYDERASALSLAFAGQVRQSPTGFSHMLSALDFAIGPSLEIVIVGEPQADDTAALLAAVRSEYVPNKIVILRSPGDDASIVEIAGFTRYQYALNDAATAYVCRNFECEFPTNDVQTMLDLIRER